MTFEGHRPRKSVSFWLKRGPSAEIVVVFCHVTGCGQSGHDESSAWSDASRDHCSAAGADAVPNGISLYLFVDENNSIHIELEMLS